MRNCAPQTEVSNKLQDWYLQVVKPGKYIYIHINFTYRTDTGSQAQVTGDKTVVPLSDKY